MKKYQISYWFVVFFFFAFVSNAYAGITVVGILLALKVTALIFTIASAIYSVVQMIRAKDMNTSSASKYVASTIQNTYSNESVVPIVYGGPLLVGGNIIWQSEPGTVVKRFLGLSVGECESVSNITVDDIDIDELPECSYTFYSGTSTQLVDSRADGICKGLRDFCYLALTLTAGEDVSRNPTVACSLTGRKIQTWNSTNQDWTTNELTASKNNAAILRDFLLLDSQLGGCGLSPIDLIDDSFGEVSEYCDEQIDNGEGVYEARFEMSISIDTEHAALDNIAKLLVTCNMSLFRSDGKYKLIIERNDKTSIFDFDKDNIIKNTFNYGYGFSERPANKVFVKWWKPDELSNPMRRAWAEDTYDIRVNGEANLTIEAVGIDRQSQAMRIAKQALYTEKVNNAWCQFSGTIASMHLELGDVCTVTHDYPGWENKLFVINGMTEVSFGEYQFYLKAYNASILDDNVYGAITGFDMPASVNPYSPVADVTDIQVTESNFINSDGTNKTQLNITWIEPTIGKANLTGYLIQWQKNDGEWYTVGTSAVGTTNYIIPEGVEVGSYYAIKIRTQSQENIISTGAIFASYYVIGSEAKPDDVSGFAFEFTTELKLSWYPVINKDIDSYEIRRSDAGWGNNDTDLIYRGHVTEHIYVPRLSGVPVRDAGPHYIKARNVRGYYSNDSILLNPVNEAPAAPSNVVGTTFFNMCKVTWDNVVDNDLVNYEIYTSHSNAWLGEEVRAASSPGVSAIVQGEPPKVGTFESGDASTIVDSSLSGLDNYARIGDLLLFTTGENNGQSSTVSDYNRETGTFNLSENLPFIPEVGDTFILIDVLYVKVRALDTFGPGEFSGSTRLQFEAITEEMLSDKIITARKLYAGELISYTAQIRDAIITSAKIQNISVDKLTAGTFAAISMVLGVGGEFKTSDYVADTTGIRMTPTGGLEINTGEVKGQAFASGHGEFSVVAQLARYKKAMDRTTNYIGTSAVQDGATGYYWVNCTNGLAWGLSSVVGEDMFDENATSASGYPFGHWFTKRPGMKKVTFRVKINRDSSGGDQTWRAAIATKEADANPDPIATGDYSDAETGFNASVNKTHEFEIDISDLTDGVTYYVALQSDTTDSVAGCLWEAEIWTGV